MAVLSEGETAQFSSSSESCLSIPSSSSSRVKSTSNGRPRSSCLGKTCRVRKFAVWGVLQVQLYPLQIASWRLLACAAISWKVSVATGAGTTVAFLSGGQLGHWAKSRRNCSLCARRAARSCFTEEWGRLMRTWRIFVRSLLVCGVS